MMPVGWSDARMVCQVGAREAGAACGWRLLQRAVRAAREFVLVGEHAVAAEDIAPRERLGSVAYEARLNLGIVGMERVEPGVLQVVARL